MDYPTCPIEISQDHGRLCGPGGLGGRPGRNRSGTTKITTDPVRLKIAADAAELIEQSGYLKEGMSFQTGASSTSLAVADEVRRRMKEKQIVGSFGLGGIHAYFVKNARRGAVPGPSGHPVL